MAYLYRQDSTIVLDLGEQPRRDVLWSLEIARWAANELERLAAELLLPVNGSGKDSGKHRLTTVEIEVQAIDNRGVGQIRLKLGRWLDRVWLGAPQSLRLARNLREAANYAERYLRDADEANPRQLLI